MPSGSIIAAALTDHAAHAKSLWLNGLDVLRQPDGGYMVPPETVHLTEAGPGAVSALDFTIEDPGSAVTIAEGSRVLFWDHAADVPLFYGFVQSWAPVPQTTWRRIEVRCIGVEALLDWQSLIGTVDPGISYTLASEYLMSAAAQAFGVGEPLNWRVNGLHEQTDQVATIAYLSLSAESALAPAGGNTAYVASGETLRDALNRIIDLSRPFFPAGELTAANIEDDVLVTVDFYGNLRIWPASLPPSHYATLTVTNTAAGAVAATVLSHQTDAGAVPHQVYVTGSNANGTGLVSDGSGLTGPIAALNEPLSDSAIRRNAFGRGYLIQLQSVIRGSLTIEKYANPSTPSSQVRAGSPLIITDASIGLASYATSIASIDKTFNVGGSENWTIHYGGHPASSMRQARHLTRDTRS